MGLGAAAGRAGGAGVLEAAAIAASKAGGGAFLGEALAGRGDAGGAAAGNGGGGLGRLLGVSPSSESLDVKSEIACQFSSAGSSPLGAGLLASPSLAVATAAREELTLSNSMFLSACSLPEPPSTTHS